MIDWEGAELCYYCNGESHGIPLSDIQFAIIAKILGLQVNENEVTFFSDNTLKHFLQIQGNPLRLVQQNND